MAHPALNHLRQVDPRLWQVWQAVHKVDPKPLIVEPAAQTDLFSHLLASIVSQQLSDKAATTIWNRVQAALPNQAVTPLAVLKVAPATLRGAGLSTAKTSYIKNIATAVHEGSLVLDDLATLPEELAIDQLVRIKGIGQWTAEMFLIFALGRQDVFSVGDLGLRRAIERWYQVPADARDRTVYHHISSQWQPFRSYAAKILWRSLVLPPDVTIKMV